jgi:hypothetical protein
MVAVEVTGALQDLVVPATEKLHDQVHGPEPATALAAPVAHKLDEGLEDTATPLALPQVGVG